MVKNLVAKGPVDSPILIYNRTIQRAEDLCASLPPGKTAVAASLSDAVTRSDIVFTCVGDDIAVTSVIESILPNVRGKLVVECSTVHPSTTAALGGRVIAAGGEFVACPVFGPPAMADTGKLVCVPAGPVNSVARVKPYCAGVIGRSIIDMAGEPWEKALQLKILGNTFILNMIEQISEGHVAAEKLGLGTVYMHQFLEEVFPAPYTAYSTRMLSGDYHTRQEPLFAVDLARKDARHAKSLAEAAGMRLHNVETADAHLIAVKEHMGERGDIAGIYGAVRNEASLEFEN